VKTLQNTPHSNNELKLVRQLHHW